MTEISAEFYFNPKGDLTASDSNQALREYVKNFEVCSKLDGDLPIFVDTNILLGYYGMSKEEKAKLLEFLDNFKTRIILTKQVEAEFLRNRLSVIRKDFFGPLNKITDDYNKMRNEIEHQLKAFRENKKKILEKDFPELYSRLQDIENEIKAAINNDEFIADIKAKIEETTTDHKNIALVDNLLEKVSQFKTTNRLSSEELKFLTLKFEEHLQDYKTERENTRWKLSIPGCGEDKEDASGDYVIYNEVLKYMKENETSSIFLTNDVSKGDWLQTDKNPHNHYIEQTYKLTKKTLFIIHAERTLPKISFENIHVSETPKKNIIISDSDYVQLYESTIINIDKEKGYGFIYTKDSNLYTTLPY